VLNPTELSVLKDEEKTYKFSASLLEKRGFLSAKIVAR
jgi:hypothetical protein